MNNVKIGELISSYRKEKNITQKEFADSLNLSDRTISKWERNIGLPDISLLPKLSHILGINIEEILSGELEVNMSGSDNMRNIKFYACSKCGNVLFSMGEANISCCARKLKPLKDDNKIDENLMSIDNLDNEYFVAINHEMTKAHFISFVAYVTSDRVLFVKLYPEQLAEIRFPKMYSGEIYAYCNKQGLWKQKIK